MPNAPQVIDTNSGGPLFIPIALPSEVKGSPVLCPDTKISQIQGIVTEQLKICIAREWKAQQVRRELQ